MDTLLTGHVLAVGVLLLDIVLILFVIFLVNFGTLPKSLSKFRADVFGRLADVLPIKSENLSATSPAFFTPNFLERKSRPPVFFKSVTSVGVILTF